jgi:hypothetical protein
MKFFDRQVLNVHHPHHKLASDTCHETLVPLETFTQWPIYYSVDYLGLHMRTHVGKHPP